MYTIIYEHNKRSQMGFKSKKIVFTDVGFHLKSGIKKLLCSQMFFFTLILDSQKFCGHQFLLQIYICFHIISVVLPLVTRVYGHKLFLQVLCRELGKDTDLKNRPETQAPLAEFLRLNGNNSTKNRTKQSDDISFVKKMLVITKTFFKCLVEKITRKQRAIYSICVVLVILDYFFNKKKEEVGTFNKYFIFF